MYSCRLHNTIHIFIYIYILYTHSGSMHIYTYTLRPPQSAVPVKLLTSPSAGTEAITWPTRNSKQARGSMILRHQSSKAAARHPPAKQQTRAAEQQGRPATSQQARQQASRESKQQFSKAARQQGHQGNQANLSKQICKPPPLSSESP